MSSKPYTLSSLKTQLTSVYHTNGKYIFKLHLKNLLYRYFYKLHTKHTFQDHFMNKPIYPKTCTIFDSCKGSCSDFKLQIYLKRVINFIVFVGWHQFIMMTTQTVAPRGSVQYSDHQSITPRGHFIMMITPNHESKGDI